MCIHVMHVQRQTCARTHIAHSHQQIHSKERFTYNHIQKHTGTHIFKHIHVYVPAHMLARRLAKDKERQGKEAPAGYRGPSRTPR